MKYLLDGQESERLIFRLITEADLPLLEDLFKDEQDRIFLALPTDMPAKELSEWWFGYCKKRYELDKGGFNALIDKASGKLVGKSGLLVQKVDEKEELEVAYAILPQYRSMGYASEAAQTCRDVAFEQGYADSLISIIHPDNQKSENVARKNGMTKTHITEIKDQRYLIYRINRSEWEHNHRI